MIRQSSMALIIVVGILSIWAVLSAASPILIASVLVGTYLALNVFLIFGRNEFLDLSSHTSNAIALSFPAMALWVRSTVPFQLLEHTGIAWATLALSLILTILAIRPWPNALSLTTMVFLFFCNAGFTYAALISINCLKDDSPGQAYQPAILSKEHSTGRYGVHDLLRLEPWGPVNEQTVVSVSSDMYSQAKPGHHVRVRVHPGTLTWPWYAIPRNETDLVRETTTDAKGP